MNSDSSMNTSHEIPINTLQDLIDVHLGLCASVETDRLSCGKIQPVRLDHALTLRIVRDSSLESVLQKRYLHDDALVLHAEPWQINLDPINYHRHKRSWSRQPIRYVLLKHKHERYSS